MVVIIDRNWNILGAYCIISEEVSIMSFWKTVLLGNSYNATRKIFKARDQNPDVHVPLILKIIGIGLVALIIYLLAL